MATVSESQQYLLEKRSQDPSDVNSPRTLSVRLLHRASWRLRAKPNTFHFGPTRIPWISPRAIVGTKFDGADMRDISNGSIVRNVTESTHIYHMRNWHNGGDPSNWPVRSWFR